FIADHGVAVVFTAYHFIAPAVLHADGFADSLREEGGILSHRVGAVMAVTARALDKYDLDICRRNLEQVGQDASHVIDALSRGPDFDGSCLAAAASDVRNSAGTGECAVRLAGVEILRCHGCRRRVHDI